MIANPHPLDPLAERYVRLVLALGHHDRDFVDAYYGPPEWREGSAEGRGLDEIVHDALALSAAIESASVDDDAMLRLRRGYLARQTAALATRARILLGLRLTFDQESEALYDAVAPHRTSAFFSALLEDLSHELPGSGPLAARVERFRHSFVIPLDRLSVVFDEAIRACRERTCEHLELPEGETLEVETVTGKSWSGYNWYQGGYRSLVQVNTDLPIFIDRAIDLAGHEGYPGHHVYHALLEKHLVRDRGWVEFSVYALFSPQSLIAEGSANYGVEVAFPAEERVEYERERLFPLAGLDPGRASLYYRVHQLIAKLSYAGNEAARQYLDGEIDGHGAVEWLIAYALMSPERARQRVSFIDQYRTYVINYNLGKDLVAASIERRAGGDRGRRWALFSELLSSPRLPSSL